MNTNNIGQPLFVAADARNSAYENNLSTVPTSQLPIGVQSNSKIGSGLRNYESMPFLGGSDEP